MSVNDPGHLVMQKYEQEMHCCGDCDLEAHLTLELQEGGGGEYLVMHAVHWSIDSQAEIDDLCAKLTAMLAQARV